MGLLTFDVFKRLPPPENGIEVMGARLRDLQAVLLEMLAEFDQICVDHGIEYQLGGGTCLGAARHQGYIPWDDDVDINMPRESYERLAVIIRDQYGDRYWLHDPATTPDYGLGFPRLRRKGTVLRTRDDFETDECGVYLDIFIIDAAPNNRILRFGHGMGSLILGFALSCRKFYRYRNNYYAMAQGDETILKTFRTKARLGWFASIMSMDWWCRAWNRWNGMIRNSTSRYVTVPVGRKHYFGEMLRREVMFPSRPMTFENREFPGPRDPDSYLSGLYGDYMAIPPAGARESHIVFEFDLDPGARGK